MASNQSESGALRFAAPISRGRWSLGWYRMGASAGAQTSIRPFTDPVQYFA
jgi:hypothetical protein